MMSRRESARVDPLEDIDVRIRFAAKQKDVYTSLKGQNYLFAKDYLNYFLDAHLTLTHK